MRCAWVAVYVVLLGACGGAKREPEQVVSLPTPPAGTQGDGDRIADRDGDGVGDVDDRCPDVPGPRPSGCPVGAAGDRDGDGVPDDVDKCPDDPEDRDGFQDSDGCPDPDNDQDGILDVNDQCPNDPETLNGYQDSDGCPDKKP